MTEHANETGLSAAPLSVLMLNYEYPPMGGGAGNATQQTARCLAALGLDVEVLTSRWRDQPDLESIDGVTVHRVVSKRRSIHDCGFLGALTYVLAAIPRLRRLAAEKRHDVYHFYFGLPTGVLAFYVHYALRRPYILSLRGSDVPGYDSPKWYVAPLHFMLKPFTSRIWGNAAAVTALSGDLKALAQETHPRIPIEIVPNAIETDAFPAPERGRRDASRRLLTVCRLIPRKGLDFLLAAMRQLGPEGFSLRIVGTGELADALADAITADGLADCVTLAGYVPRDELHREYGTADAFVLPSLSESFGLVLLEAMSCGLPIVATRTGGIPELIHDGTQGFLAEPGNADELARAVRALFADDDRRWQIGQANATQVRTSHTWPAIAERTRQLYDDAVHSGRGHR